MFPDKQSLGLFLFLFFFATFAAKGVVLSVITHMWKYNFGFGLIHILFNAKITEKNFFNLVSNSNMMILLLSFNCQCSYCQYKCLYNLFHDRH